MDGKKGREKEIEEGKGKVCNTRLQGLRYEPRLWNMMEGASWSGPSTTVGNEVVRWS